MHSFVKLSEKDNGCDPKSLDAPLREGGGGENPCKNSNISDFDETYAMLVYKTLTQKGFQQFQRLPIAFG